MAEFWEAPELRIVLLGKTGSGKSATGNTILGRKHFTSVLSPGSVTKECQKGEALVGGKKIVVVDTPGLFDTQKSSEEIFKEIKKCVKWAYPGPHVFILVIKLVHFSREEEEVVELIQKIFSCQTKKYFIVVFSHKDFLEGRPLEDFLKDGAKLKALIAKCGNRHMAFNNRAEGEEKEGQVSELLQMIDAMLENNNQYPYFTEDMLKRDKKMYEENQRSQSSWCRTQ